MTTIFIVIRCRTECIPGDSRFPDGSIQPVPLELRPRYGRRSRGGRHRADAALGTWQLGVERKSSLAERILAASRDASIALPAVEIRAEDVAWRRVEVRGRFEPKYAVFIDNRILHGAAGYHVVMPLRIADSERYVLVNRGWVAGSPARSELPQITTPAETVSIAGLATVPSQRYFELSTKWPRQGCQNLTLERYRETMPIAIQPS